MKDVNLAASFVPLVSIVLVVALFACGNIWKNGTAVVLTGCISIWWAVVFAVYYGYFSEWLNSGVYVLFVALYLFITRSLVTHLSHPVNSIPDHEVVPNQSAFWGQHHGND